MYKLPEMGGREVIRAMPNRKHSFFSGGVPLNTLKHWLNTLYRLIKKIWQCQFWGNVYSEGFQPYLFLNFAWLVRWLDDDLTVMPSRGIEWIASSYIDWGFCGSDPLTRCTNPLLLLQHQLFTWPLWYRCISCIVTILLYTNILLCTAHSPYNIVTTGTPTQSSK